MTFTGKPSTACRTCRQRRIRCDEARPSCGQCKKKRRECGGYPNLDDVLFQNQTNAVIQRAKRINENNAKRSSKQSPSSTVSAVGSPSNNGSSPIELVSIVPNPAIPIEARAVDFLLTIQLLEPQSRGRVMGHLSCLPALYSASLSTSVLARVTTCASLAAMTLVGRDDHRLREAAYNAYGQALISLYRAMGDPKEQLRNETLVACLLMMVVESMLATDYSPNQQWAAHVKGASQLLRYRGRDAIASDTLARKIWSVVRGSLAQNPTNELLRDELFAEDLPADDAMSKEIRPPEAQLGMLTMAVANLRNRGLNILASMKVEPHALHALLGECQFMLGALTAWATNLPETYQYITVQNLGTPTSSPGSDGDGFQVEADNIQHIYTDSHLQRLWNSYRVASIACNALIYRIVTRHSMTLSNAFELASNSGQALIRVAAEIVASIPPHILEPTHRFRSNSYCALSEIAFAFYSLWPLFVARGVVLLPQEMKDNITVIMLRLVENYEVRRGKALIEISLSDQKRPLWCSPWQDGWMESVWEWSFLYGCGAV